MTDTAINPKENAARRALGYIRDGMTIGLGTGSTAGFFIAALAERVSAGWRVAGVPTSQETERLARQAGIDIVEPQETSMIEIAVDGADEVDRDFNLIKGGGGALFREKIIASAAQRFLVIIDETKRVNALGSFPLPIELAPFSWALTTRAIREAIADAGYEKAKIALRANEKGPLLTDNGNLILDCQLGRIENAPSLNAALNQIPGVIETGLFIDMVDMVIVGSAHGATVDDVRRPGAGATPSSR